MNTLARRICARATLRSARIAAVTLLFVPASFGCSSSSAGLEADASLPDTALPDTAPPDACAAAAGYRAAPATCAGTLPDRFDTSTVLAAGCYRAAATPRLGATAKLTLSPGTTILFAKKAGLDIATDQVLVAVGTAAAPICLTGATAARGAWDGVHYQSTANAENALDYVTIEYAGDTQADSEAAAIKMISDSRPTRLSVSHTTVRESLGYGIWLAGSSQIGAFSTNVLTRNTLGPADVDSSIVEVLDTASSYTGNDVDRVRVRANSIPDAATWQSLGVPYYLDAGLHVGAPWTIAPGTTLIMVAKADLMVSGDAAAIHAVGTAAAPIVFTGADKKRGGWGGIQITNSNNAATAFAYATVEYAGGTPDISDVALISTGFPVRASFSHVTLRQSLGYGLILGGNSVVPQFEANTLTANALGPARADSSVVHQLLPGSTYTGNDVDEVAVQSGRVGAVTWQALGVPLTLDAGLHVDKVLTVKPGVTIRMAAGGHLWIDGDDAGLNAVGTAAAPIVFTGAVATKGYWGALAFGTTLNSANVLEYVTIEYGGSPAQPDAASVTATSDSHGVRLTMRNGIVRHSGKWGVFLAHYAQTNGDLESSTTFSDNASGNVLRDP